MCWKELVVSMTIFKDKYGNKLENGEVVAKIANRLNNYLLDFELMLLRWIGYVPLHSIRMLVYKIFGIKIGKASAIHMWANFFQPKNISIGEDTIIGDHAFLDGREKLVIGSHVDIASSVFIYNSEHDVNSTGFSAICEPVEIADYVFIGPRVTILPGVHIGKGAVVAAGAVVTKDVADFKIVGGVPAKVIGERKNNKPSYTLGRPRLFQ